MKILNVILCVFIFLLAVASAVASYLLYEKRVQLVNGWGKMAAAISQTSKTLENGSGQNVAKKLTVDELGHLKYAELDSKLGGLKQLADGLVRQRDFFVENMGDIGRNSEMASLPDAGQLKNFETYRTSGDSVVRAVNDLKLRRNLLANLIRTQAGRFGVTITDDALLRGNANAAMGKFVAKLNGIQDQFRNYRNYMDTIYQTAGGKGRVWTGDANLKRDLEKVSGQVSTLRNQYRSAVNKIREVEGARDAANKLADQRKKKIEDLQIYIASLKEESNQYRRALGLDEASPVKKWEDGSADSRKLVRGKVIAVNEKFGYIGIDFGTATTVRQPRGGKPIEINPQIAAGMNVYVYRPGSGDGAGEYIGKVKLSTVESNTSIAESLELAPGRKIKVGDEVRMEDWFKVVNKK